MHLDKEKEMEYMGYMNNVDKDIHMLMKKGAKSLNPVDIGLMYYLLKTRKHLKEMEKEMMGTTMMEPKAIESHADKKSYF